MNEKPKEELFDIFIYFVAGYILISWILAFLLFCYEFLIGPMSNTLSPGNNSVYLKLSTFYY